MTTRIDGTASAEPAGTERPQAAAAPAVASPLARGALRIYAVGIAALFGAVVVQFLLAGLGIFYGGDFLPVWHATVGASVIFLLSLILAGVGRLARLPGRTLWLTASVAGLVLVQSLLLVPWHSDATGVVRALSSLHVVNALLIFWVVLRLVTRAYSLRA